MQRNDKILHYRGLN
ncbi:hypothetical protein [Escherichia coli]|nr:hypothetical protein [Escherichia coli]